MGLRLVWAVPHVLSRQNFMFRLRGRMLAQNHAFGRANGWGIQVWLFHQVRPRGHEGCGWIKRGSKVADGLKGIYDADPAEE